MYQSAIAEGNLENLCLMDSARGNGDTPSALFILTVPLHVENTVELLVMKMYLDLNTIRQTTDNHFWSGEICAPPVLVVYRWINGLVMRNSLDKEIY